MPEGRGAPALPPTLPGPGDARADADALAGADKLGLLHALLLLFVLTVAGGNLYLWLTFGWHKLNPAMLIAPLGAGLAFAAARRGQVAAGFRIVLVSAALLVLLNAFRSVGIFTPSLAALPTLLALAAFTTDRRTTLGLGAAVLALLGLLTYADGAHLLGSLRLQSDAAVAVIESVMIAIAATLSLAVARHFHGQYGRALALANDLQQRLDALHGSEARFTTLFRASPIPCMITDRRDLLVDANDAWLLAFGLEREAALGRSTLELAIWHNESERQSLRHELAAGGPATLPVHSLHLRTAGEQPRRFLASITRIVLSGLPCYLFTLLDQTDRLAAEEAQRALNADLAARVDQRNAELSQTIASLRATREELMLSEKLAALGALVAGIASDLHAPIREGLAQCTALERELGDFERLQADGSLNRPALAVFLDRMRDGADAILNAAARAAELIRSFKQAAILQTEEERSAFDLRAVAEQVRAASASARAIEVDIAPGLVCDSFLGPFRQVLGSLIEHAATHADAGGLPGPVRVHGEQRGDFLILSVLHLPQFDAAASDAAGLAARVPQRDGGLLDLPVCQRIAATVLGGTLSATMETGRPAQFTLMLPLAAPGRI